MLDIAILGHADLQVKEASKIYGVTTIEHPAVSMITMERGRYYMGGKLQVRLQQGAHVPGMWGQTCSCST